MHLKSQMFQFPIKSDQGVRMLRVPNFVNNYTIGCANSQKLYCWVHEFTKKYTDGYAIFIHKGLHSLNY